MKIFVYSLILFIGIPAAKAQHFLGVATDGWSSMNTLYLNPANLGGREEQLAINILSLNLSYDNSGATLGNTGGLFKPNGGRYNSLFGSNTTSFNAMVPTGEVRGPGVLVAVNGENCLALTTGIRGMNQFTNFDPSLYSAITHPGTIPDNNFHSSAQDFNWNAQMWSQIGLTYAVVMERGNNQFNFGLTVRYLEGLGFTAIKGYSLKN